MPVPIEICVEELDMTDGKDSNEECFIRCVALSGSEPGLALDRSGELRWMPSEPSPYGLWVSADEKLVLLREQDAGPIRVERGERSLEAPEDKPVILRDQDILSVAGRRLRVHVHGRTEAVHAPERLSRSSFGRLARAAAMAATLALGGAAAAGGAGPAGAGNDAVAGGQDLIEVRNLPPKMAPRDRLDYTITSQAVKKKGPLTIRASCKSTAKLNKGMYGEIIDPKTNYAMKDGGVTIKSISGKKIVVEASTLKKRIKSAKILRFWVNRY